MGNRLSKIYTRTGDKGETGLAGGERVSKDNALRAAIGDVDELNSLLGLLVCKLQGDLKKDVLAIQNDLFNVGGELSSSQSLIKQQVIGWLEKRLDDLNGSLSPLKEFILPGGGEAASLCHLARAVCRRAERNIVSASKQHVIHSEVLVYMNRLSDLLFVMARTITRQMDEQEVYWQSERLRDGD